ncbi:MAG: lytic transglycosylase domain-containing protein [Myxococcales bacterium]|nr:lytic transglycosylase domain-containing protein [Myxococcales bacterium]
MIAAILSLLISAPTNDPIQEWISSATSSSTRALREAIEAHRQQQWARVLQLLPTGEHPDRLEQWLTASALKVQRPKAAYEALGIELSPSRCVAPEDNISRQRLLTIKAQLLSAKRPMVAAELFAQLGTAPALFDAINLADQRGPARRWRQQLLLNFPDSPESHKILEKLGPKGVLATFDTLKGKLDLLEAFLEAHLNTTVLMLAKVVSAQVSSIPHQCRLGYYVGKALRKLRQYDEALNKLKHTRQKCMSTYNAGAWDLKQLTMQVALLEARLLNIKGKAKALEELAYWMITFAANHSYIDDVFFLAARNLGKKAALARFERVVQLGGDQAPVAAWQLALHALDEGANNMASHWLGLIAAMPNASLDDHERAEFFLGRIEVSTHQVLGPAATIATRTLTSRWEELARRPSFYGFLALSRLHQHAPIIAQRIEKDLLALASSTTSFEISPYVLEHPHAQQARRWFKADAQSWAISELRALSCEIDLKDPRHVLTLASLFDAMGAYSEAQQLIRGPGRSWLKGPFSSKNLPAWRIAYSRPFVQEFKAAAKTENVDPFLLTAVAREESAFDAKVVSWAGAVGLAQLMPSTASDAYRSVYGGQLDLSRLTIPYLNLRLGAWVLKRNLSAFKGITAFALSAYNGGAGRTRRTLPTAVMPYEDWIESTRVQETRAYIKRVSATWAIYTLLHAHQQPLPSFPVTVGPGLTTRH